MSIRASTSSPSTSIRTQGSSQVVVCRKGKTASASPPQSTRYGASSPNDFISSQMGSSMPSIPAKRPAGLRVAVRLQVDEGERDLGVHPQGDVPARFVRDTAQERLRGLVVAEEVLELAEPAGRTSGEARSSATSSRANFRARAKSPAACAALASATRGSTLRRRSFTACPSGPA